MTYRGITISRPTLALVDDFIKRKKYDVKADDVFAYWEEKGWLTKKGVEVKTLEASVTVYKGVVNARKLMENGPDVQTKKSKKARKKERKKAREAARKANAVIPLNNKVERMPYDEQLTDPRWKAYRKFVFAVRGRQCERCGSTERLQVHHPRYRTGLLAWEYGCREVMVLCRACHMEVHGIVKDNGN